MNGGNTMLIKAECYPHSFLCFPFYPDPKFSLVNPKSDTHIFKPRRDE